MIDVEQFMNDTDIPKFKSGIIYEWDNDLPEGDAECFECGWKGKNLEVRMTAMWLLNEVWKDVYCPKCGAGDAFEANK